MTKNELLSNFGSKTWFKNEVNKTLSRKENIDIFNLKLTDTLHDFSTQIYIYIYVYIYIY